MIRIRSMVLTLCLIAGCCAAVLALAAVPAAAQEETGPPGPPDEDKDGRGGGPRCGPNAASGELCWEPEVCAALEVVCNGVNPGERPDHERGAVVCTGDESQRGARMGTCTAPAPDPPEPGELTRITRIQDIGCNAVPPAPDWTSAGLPDQTIHANPDGSADQPGVTGLDTWLWATGEQAHFWTTTGIGHAARRVWAQDATLDDDGDVTGWGPEYILETQTWPCMRQAAWSARIIAWHWTLEGPKTLTAASGRAGFQPALDGDGREASARLMPETKGRYTAHLQTTWQADWGPAVRFTQTHPPIDYLIGEIRSQLLPNQP